MYVSSIFSIIDCKNSLIRSENDTIELVGIGLKNIIAVAMNDAVLIADMSKSQDVKKAVDILKEKKAVQAIQFPKDHRPENTFLDPGKCPLLSPLRGSGSAPKKRPGARASNT